MTHLHLFGRISFGRFSIVIALKENSVVDRKDPTIVSPFDDRAL
jgi:hypothetical protein